MNTVRKAILDFLPTDFLKINSENGYNNTFKNIYYSNKPLTDEIQKPHLRYFFDVDRLESKPEEEFENIRKLDMYFVASTEDYLNLNKTVDLAFKGEELIEDLRAYFEGAGWIEPAYHCGLTDLVTGYNGFIEDIKIVLIDTFENKSSIEVLIQVELTYTENFNSNNLIGD